MFVQVVITLSSVVSSLKMDATKILEEMDQFKELWNQVALTCRLHSNTFFYSSIKRNRKKRCLPNCKSKCNLSNLEVETCQWC